MTEHKGKPVRVRFAPSPTGPLHLGSARTALFNALFAKAHKGAFVMRIEDTDKERSKKEYEDNIFESLSWLGIGWDEGPDKGGDYGPYRQSERIKIYKKYLDKLLYEKKAYYCYCTKEELEAERQSMIAQGLPPKYSGHCRNLESPPAGKTPQLVRFKTPESRVEFKDLIRGNISFDAALFGDLPLAKDLTSPLYNFAVVVDDAEMAISHVIRGEDHLSNTPKQILLQHALGFEEPVYAHLPLILAADKSKLSKRYADVAVLEYRTQGYLPEALINFLVLLGWHPKDNREIFIFDELVSIFDIKRVQKAGAVFNTEKLAWLNHEHVKRLSTDQLVELMTPFLVEERIKTSKTFLRRVIEAERERIKTLHDFLASSKFFFLLPEYDTALLKWTDAGAPDTKIALQESLNILEKKKADDWDEETLHASFEQLLAEKGKGIVLWPLRVALSGLAASPDPFAIMSVLGKEESLERIRSAVQKLGTLF